MPATPVSAASCHGEYGPSLALTILYVRIIAYRCVCTRCVCTHDMMFVYIRALGCVVCAFIRFQWVVGKDRRYIYMHIIAGVHGLRRVRTLNGVSSHTLQAQRSSHHRLSQSVSFTQSLRWGFRLSESERKPAENWRKRNKSSRKRQKKCKKRLLENEWL